MIKPARRSSPVARRPSPVARRNGDPADLSRLRTVTNPGGEAHESLQGIDRRRATSDGHFLRDSPFRRQQNRLSGQVYHDKHNAARQPK